MWCGRRGEEKRGEENCEGLVLLLLFVVARCCCACVYLRLHSTPALTDGKEGVEAGLPRPHLLRIPRGRAPFRAGVVCVGVRGEVEGF